MIPQLKNIFLHKCPRCGVGNLHPDNNAYHLKQTAVMHPRCPACDLNFLPEPGYYYGAMYVSYAFTIAIGAGVFILHYLLHGKIEVWWFLAELTLMLLVAAPYTFRTARAIWISFFNKYNPELHDELVASSKAPRSA